VTAEVCPVGTIVSGSEVRSCDQTLRVQMKLNVAWTAGVGVDFTLPIHDRKIYLRTGVQYFGEWLDFEGFGERTDRGSGPDAINQPGVPLAVTTICCATTTTTLHALGPRLGINAEAARVGPVGLHVFAEVSAYWYLNPDVIEFGAVTPSGEAAYSVRPYPFVGQGAAGVRIVWSPN
jgi:hypothetical protein